MTGGSLAMSAEAHASGRRDPRRCTRCLVCPGSSVHPGPLPPAMRRRMEQAGVARRFLNVCGSLALSVEARAAGRRDPRPRTRCLVRPGPLRPRPSARVPAAGQSPVPGRPPPPHAPLRSSTSSAWTQACCGQRPTLQDYHGHCHVSPHHLLLILDD